MVNYTGADFDQVGVGLILFENLRRGRQETSRREDVADRLNELEASEQKARKYYAEALVKLEDEVIKLRAKNGMGPNDHHRILPKSVWDLADKEDKEDDDKEQGWLSWIPRFSKRVAPENDDILEKRHGVESAKNQTADSNTGAQDVSTSTSLWSKISPVPRSHPRDISRKTPETPVEQSPNNTRSNSKSTD